MERKWWKEGVVYQIYPRSFYDSNGDGIGDLKGIIAKLDYLQQLGVTIIWLNPVYKSPNDDNGYDISDYRDIMDEFGTMADWEELMQGLHTRGIKLIMDLVVNHSSDEHPWFVEARKSKDNPYRDYYIWKKGKDDEEPNNWVSFFNGSAWKYDEVTEEYYLHLFTQKQPDLNWENPKVRQEVYDLMTFWLDKGIDGFRMDVINLISKVPGLPSVPHGRKGEYVWAQDYFANGPRVHEFLQEMHEKVLSRYDVMTVGETPFVTPEDGVLYTEEDRKEVNMIFQFEHMDVDHGPEGIWDLKPWKLTDLKEITTKWQSELQGKGWNSQYLNNHDQPRQVSRFGNDSMYRVESAKMLATYLHTLQGTPYIYQGEEIGMTNVAFDTIEEYRDVATLNAYREAIKMGKTSQELMSLVHYQSRDNARTPMQWDISDHAGFTEGTPWISVNPNYKDINVEQALQDTNSIFYYYQRLLKLRKDELVLVYGEYTIILPEDESIYAYMRTLQDERVLVIMNFFQPEIEFTLPEHIDFARAQLLLSNYEINTDEGISEFTLRPYEARVYKLF